jgi:hypothetical protein
VGKAGLARYSVRPPRPAAVPVHSALLLAQALGRAEQFEGKLVGLGGRHHPQPLGR